MVLTLDSFQLQNDALHHTCHFLHSSWAWAGVWLRGAHWSRRTLCWRPLALPVGTRHLRVLSADALPRARSENVRFHGDQFALDSEVFVWHGVQTVMMMFVQCMQRVS